MPDASDDASAGSEAHKYWLDQQLARSSSREPPQAQQVFSTRASYALESATSPVKAYSAVSAERSCSGLQREHAKRDSSVGTSLHSAWMERQLSAANFHHQHQHQPRSPPRQPDDALPSGVNALLRGQDLSASNHAEWLDAQLSRGGRGGAVFLPASASQTAMQPPPPPPPTLWPPPQRSAATAVFATTADRLQPPQAPRLPVAPNVSGTTPATRPRGVHSHASGQEDCALGSAVHTSWLDRQLRSQRPRFGM